MGDQPHSVSVKNFTHTVSLSNEGQFCTVRDECQLYRGHNSSFPRSHLRSALVFFKGRDLSVPSALHCPIPLLLLLHLAHQCHLVEGRRQHSTKRYVNVYKMIIVVLSSCHILHMVLFFPLLCIIGIFFIQSCLSQLVLLNLLLI